MPKGLILSVAVHGGLLAAVLLGLGVPHLPGPVPEDAILVEVVAPDQAPPPPERAKPPESKPPESKPPEPDLSFKPSHEAADKLQTKKGASPAPTPAAAPPPAPRERQEAAAEPPPAAAPAPEPAPQPPSEKFSLFDPATMVMMHTLQLPEYGFDAPAATTARLSQAEVENFRAQLRRCWRQPAGVGDSSRTRVVLRLAFKPDGVLAAEPSLIEASASQEGPAVFQAAVRAVEQCQPYRAFPRDRYQEWKVLDVGFSPREMTGG